MARTVAVDIIARDKASKAFSDVAGHAESASKRIGSALGGIAKTAAVGLGAAGVGGIFAVLKTGFDEARDASAGAKQLQAAIKSTGNAAHVTVGGMENLASAIQSYSGQTDDSVVAAESLLLTFTNVRNEVGKGNDIFNQATTAAADMAARMGGDASTNAIRLGKALNDPVKGVTALTKVGVSFTKGQKDQIAALVKSGKTLDAQKIILGELNKEFGGSAKAAGESLPGQLARTKRAFEDVSQSIVTKTLPYLTKFLGFINKKIIPGLSAMQAAFSGEGITSDGFVGIMERIGVQARAVVDWVKKHWPEIKAVFLAVAAAVISAIQTALNVIRALIPTFKAIIDFLVQHKDVVITFALVLGTLIVAWKTYVFVMKIVAAGQALFNAVLAANPIGLVIVALAALTAGFIYAYKHSETFRQVVQDAWKGIQAVVAVVWPILKRNFDALVAIIQVVATKFSWLYTNVWAPTALRLITVGKTVGDGLRWAYDHVIAPTLTTIHRAVGGAIEWVKRAVNTISDLWKTIGDGLQYAYDHSIGPILTGIQDFINTIEIQLKNLMHPGGIGGTTVKGVGSAGPPISGPGSPGAPGTPRMRAHGGPVRANTPYIVGDGGVPELFVPKQNGRILPNVPAAGKYVIVEHMEVNLRTDPPISFEGAGATAAKAALAEWGRL